MTRQKHAFEENEGADAGRHLARLRHVLGLARQIAGRASDDSDSSLEENASVSSAYALAPPVVQRRFDTLVAETSCWASAGLDALASVKDPCRQPRVAAARLADELEYSLARMRKLLGL